MTVHDLMDADQPSDAIDVALLCETLLSLSGFAGTTEAAFALRNAAASGDWQPVVQLLPDIRAFHARLMMESSPDFWLESAGIGPDYDPGILEMAADIAMVRQSQAGLVGSLIRALSSSTPTAVLPLDAPAR